MGQKQIVLMEMTVVYTKNKERKKEIKKNLPSDGLDYLLSFSSICPMAFL